jgi:hypothetical protein
MARSGVLSLDDRIEGVRQVRDVISALVGYDVERSIERGEHQTLH